MIRTEFQVRTENLPDLVAGWNNILAQSSISTVFVRPIWHQVWLRSFQDGRSQAFHTVRDGDRLLGVAPLLSEDHSLAFSGDPDNCDYMDFVLDRDVEEPALRAIFDAIAAGNWKELRLW